ncbi:MAG: TPM domain-containing protein [Gemmatimonadaceae bacterium]
MTRWSGSHPGERPARRRTTPLLLLLLLLLLPLAPLADHGGLLAQAELDGRFPSQPPASGFVLDATGLLDAAAVARLNERILGVQRRTGGDVGVVLLADLDDRAPSDMGVAIYRWWGVGRVDSIGSSRRDLGALLLIVPREVAPSGRGECWITTGRGAEAELHDADAGTICRTAVIPELRERRYEAAIAAGVDAIGAQFAETTAGAAPLSRDDEGGSSGGRRGALSDRGSDRVLWMLGGGAGGAAGLAGIALLVRRWRRRRPRPCPKGHGPMSRLSEAADDAALADGQRAEERLGSVDYDVWACPACPERMVIAYRRWSSYKGCPRCRFRTMKTTTRTLESATVSSTGMEEVELQCLNCGYRHVTRRVTPKLSPPATGSGSRFSGGGGGGGGGGSFGGSGSTGGGGGGSSY